MLTAHAGYRACCLLLTTAALSGCAALDAEVQGMLSTFQASDALDEMAADLPPDVPFATVVMATDGEDPVAAQYPLHQVAYIQGVLEKTGLNDRFRRVDVELFRNTPSGVHRLEIRYDRAEHRVDPRYDYALQPGDRLVVTENTSTVLDDMLESLALPVGKYK